MSTEGPAEVTQFLQRITADAWPIAGGVILMAGPELWPVCWVAEEGPPAVEAFARRQQDAAARSAGGPLQTAWDCTWPESGPGQRVARLTIWASQPNEQAQALSVWWDAHRHRIVLDYLVQTQHLLLLAAKPSLRALQSPAIQPLPAGVGVWFDSPLTDLATLLAEGGEAAGAAPAG